MTPKLTPIAIKALTLLEGTSPRDTRSARALANLMWPEKMAECKTSPRRGGMYRAAGAYFSKLMHAGWCQHYMNDFESGYYITEEGKKAIMESRRSN